MTRPCFVPGTYELALWYEYAPLPTTWTAPWPVPRGSGIGTASRPAGGLTGRTRWQCCSPVQRPATSRWVDQILATQPTHDMHGVRRSRVGYPLAMPALSAARSHSQRHDTAGTPGLQQLPPVVCSLYSTYRRRPRAARTTRHCTAAHRASPAEPMKAQRPACVPLASLAACGVEAVRLRLCALGTCIRSAKLFLADGSDVCSG
jgi:hypothetical protein